MKTEKIKSIFQDYLHTPKTQFAILINGSWGSGKTFFWKNTLALIAANEGYKTVYVSLNGVGNIADIERKILISLWFGKKDSWLRNRGTLLGRNILNVTSKRLLKVSFEDLFKDVNFTGALNKKILLCFDDLERCQIPIKEVLGYINDFVEHKGLKTVIVADESKIDDSDMGYNNIKEKVLGRVLNFHLEVEEFLLPLFETYKGKNNQDFFEFLLSKQAFLIDLLKEFKQDNLRTVSFLLEILHKLFSVLNDTQDVFVDEAILFSALITFEFKAGRLTSNDYRSNRNLDLIDGSFYARYLANAAVDKQTNDNTNNVNRSYLIDFYERYLKSRSDDYFFYPSIFKYILSGYYDQIGFEREIRGRVRPEVLEETVAFRKLLTNQFKQLSDEEFRKLFDIVVKHIGEGNYWIYDYVQISVFFYFFSRNKLIPQNQNEISQILKAGIHKGKFKTKIDDRILDHLTTVKDGVPEVDDIKELIREIHFEIKNENNREFVNSLIESLTDTDNRPLSFYFERVQSSNELFAFLDREKLFNAIVHCSNYRLTEFIGQLKLRYTSINIRDFLKGDLICLEFLKDKLTEYIAALNEPKPLRFFLLGELHTILKGVCDKLGDSSKIQ